MANLGTWVPTFEDIIPMPSLYGEGEMSRKEFYDKFSHIYTEPDNQIGEGAYGVVYASGDIVVKTGEVEPLEVRTALEAGKAGLGPKVLGYTINGRDSMVAMERVRGITYEEAMEDAKYGQPGEPQALVDKLIETRAKVARAGFYHGDLHSHNVLVDNDTGEFMVIDWGLGRSKKIAGVSSQDIEEDATSVLPGYLDTAGRLYTKDEAMAKLREVSSKSLENSMDDDYTIYTGVDIESAKLSRNYERLYSNWLDAREEARAAGRNMGYFTSEALAEKLYAGIGEGVK
ncbi:RIO-like putative serine/threonine kinase [Synechococcus phage S-CBWM1]|uniref:RIO-like putative serine/threonine kinase n=1 Tax=Synechococcus phage S-CBWM1 TaxID=2053653 RepID=A0A3G1L3P9_9CAUD|nr:RIO-like putative serine/threonine kinase [Synechococcus phage S-CBWM1]ATW62797.1 RIO-like putative serine/threonine kinase [Synechococcus phage S-CBWM1]